MGWPHIASAWSCGNEAGEEAAAGGRHAGPVKGSGHDAVISSPEAEFDDITLDSGDGVRVEVETLAADGDGFGGRVGLKAQTDQKKDVGEHFGEACGWMSWV